MKRDKWIQTPASVEERENAKKIAKEYDISMAALVRALLRYAQQYRPRLEIEAGHDG